MQASSGAAQLVDQAVEFVQRAERDGEFAHLLHPAVTLDALLDPDLDLGGQQVGEFFLDAPALGSEPLIATRATAMSHDAPEPGRDYRLSFDPRDAVAIPADEAA